MLGWDSKPEGPIAGHEAEVYYHLGGCLRGNACHPFQRGVHVEVLCKAALRRLVCQLGQAHAGGGSQFYFSAFESRVRRCLNAKQTGLWKRTELQPSCVETVPAYEQAINLTREDRPHYLHERQGSLVLR